MRTHPVVLVLGFMFMACALIAAVVLLADGTPRTSHVQARESGCACAATTHVTKFLIFWKEKEKEGDKAPNIFKISDKLFDSVVDAWKTVPPNAAEVRIITVRLD